MSEFDPKEFIASLPRRPGVYRMFGAGHELLYVGKARSLRDRVGTYFAPRNVDPKVRSLTAQIEGVEVTVTNSETEALLLEYNLIKAHKPRFNVVLRDDKSFPYIHLYVEHEFPRLEFYRGAKSAPGRYFGPFPSAGAVRDTLNQLQKLFRIRNCRDSFFANRSRPCLQHQIGRCSAPCVGLIPRDAYAQDITAAVKVLEGRSDEVNAELEKRMEEAVGALHFERAARAKDGGPAARARPGGALGGAHARECGAGAAHAARTARGTRRDVLRPGRHARPARAARTDRVLRHQPHGRRGHGGLLRRIRPRRTAEEGVPALQHQRRYAGRRLRGAAPGARAPLPPCARRRGVAARPAADRWRCGAGEPGARRARGARVRRPDAGRNRQGPRAQGGPRAVVRVRRSGAGDARGSNARGAPDPENPRRGPPLRDHRSSPQACPPLQRVGAGGGPGTRARQSAGAPEALRRTAGRDARRSGRSHAGGGNRRDAGAKCL